MVTITNGETERVFSVAANKKKKVPFQNKRHWHGSSGLGSYKRLCHVKKKKKKNICLFNIMCNHLENAGGSISYMLSCATTHSARSELKQMKRRSTSLSVKVSVKCKRTYT